ncbi:hypothetical protein Tco_0318321 [Tanacetum coccineum]
MFKSLEREQEQEQERAIVTLRALWRSVLALEAWARHVGTQMTDMSVYVVILMRSGKFSRVLPESSRSAYWHDRFAMSCGGPALKLCSKLVMSTLAYVDSETITQADGAQSARLPVPLPDDPYVAVRHASEEFKDSDPLGTRIDSSHSLASLDSTAPLLPDHPLTHVLPTPTPIRASFHRRTARMIVRAQPAMSLGVSASVTEVMALSDAVFRKRYRSSYETPSPSPTFLVRKRYRGTSKLILDTDSEGDKFGDEDIEEDESLDANDDRERSDDEGHGLGYEDHGLDDEGRGLEGEGLGLVYGALRRRELAVGEDQVPSTFEVDPKDGRVYTDIPAYVPPIAHVQTPPSPEWSSGSLPISSSSQVVPSPIALLVATTDSPIITRFRSLKREHERATVTFRALWRIVLALEAWAGHVDTQMEDMSRA